MQSGIRLSALMVIAVLGFAGRAHAHVSLTGPGYAKQSQVLTFNVAHGCSGADTVKLEVQIPKDVTTVRALPNVFGDVQVNTDDSGVVSSVVWSKDKARPQDDLYYQMSIRIGVPDEAFTTLYFPTIQTCRDKDGNETTVMWSQLPGDMPPDGGEATPAPKLLILPARVPGWNEYTVKDKITEMSVFDDAQIVWAGDAAYSSNLAIADMIKAESGVSTLSEIDAGTDIWVKY